MGIHIGLNNACCVFVPLSRDASSYYEGCCSRCTKNWENASFKCCTFNIYQLSIRIYAQSNRRPMWSIALLNYGATQHRGGNSLRLRAISSQNKNISFQRKSQINTGFAWTRFYLPKNCHFLTHFIHCMKDVSWELGKMSFMRAHTHPISLTLSQSQRNTDSPLPFSLSCSFSHTPYTHTCSTYLCTYRLYTHASISSCSPKGFCFPPCLAFLTSKGPLVSQLTLDEPVWRHHIVVSSFHINGVFTSFDKSNQDTWRTVRGQ